MAPPCRGTSYSAVGEAALQVVDGVRELVGQPVPEDREVLPDERHLCPPLVAVDAEQLLHVLLGDVDPLDVDRAGGGYQADRRLHRVTSATDPLEDPLEHTGVLAVA